MRTYFLERPPITGRQIAFEIASQITAGVSGTINIVRRLYVAICRDSLIPPVGGGHRL
jgi:hypothetical protein